MAATNTNLLPDVASSAPANASLWVFIVGACFGVVTFLFLIYLVLSGRKLDKTQRGLIALIAAIMAAFAFAFLGGYAKAQGAIPVFENARPIEFGVGGGIAVFVVVYLLLWATLVRETGPETINKGFARARIPPNTTLREAIEAVVGTAEKEAIFDPENEKFDKLYVKEGMLSAKSLQKLIELFGERLIGGERLNYAVVIETETNIVRIKS